MFRPIKMADIELSRPLPDLVDLAGYGAVRGLVRLHGTPLGFVDAPVVDGRCSAASLGAAVLAEHRDVIRRELVRHALGEPVTGAPHTRPSVSVAVCTRDRPGDLEHCLAALAAVHDPSLEVLVVDNAPATDATQRLVRSKFEGVRYVREPRPGLDWARNRALAEARGEILAYTDDDVVVDGGWVAALARIFAESPGVAAVTGLVVPLELETEAQLLFENYGAFGQGFQRSWNRVDRADGERVAARYGATGKFGTGANMAFRRDVLLRLGGFDPALDVGTVTQGGGDLEMFFRVLREGYTLVREPRAVVRHRHRRDYAGLRAQLRTWGVGMYSYVTRSWMAYPDERAGFLWIAARWLGLRNARRLLWSLFHDRYPRELLVDEISGARFAPWRYRAARDAAAAIEAELGPIPLPPSAPPIRRVHGRGSRERRKAAVRTVDLAEQVTAVGDVDSAAMVLVDVRWRSQPAGRVTLRPRGDSIPASELRDAITDRLAEPVLRLLGSQYLADSISGSSVLQRVLDAPRSRRILMAERR